MFGPRPKGSKESPRGSKELPRGCKELSSGCKEPPKTSSGDQFYIFKVPINRKAAASI